MRVVTPSDATLDAIRELLGNTMAYVADAIMALWSLVGEAVAPLVAFVCRGDIATTVDSISSLDVALDVASRMPTLEPEPLQAAISSSQAVQPTSTAAAVVLAGPVIPAPLPNTSADERPITSHLAPHRIRDGHNVNARPTPRRRRRINQSPVATATSSIWTQMTALSTSSMHESPNMPLPPGVPIAVVDWNVVPVYDELLLPPQLRRMNAFGLEERYQGDELWRSDPRSRDQDPPYTMYVCGCGWCPNHTAAYPLYAAVTIRRTLRRLGIRATQSVASVTSYRQNTCGNRDPTVVFAGRWRG